MDRIAVFVIVTGLLLSAIGIVILGGTIFGEWFDPEARGTVKTFAAAAPFLGLVMIGFAGSRSGHRPLPRNTA